MGRGIRRDLRQAGRIAQDTLPMNPLSRVDNTRSDETQNLLNMQYSSIDPNSQGYAGRRSADMQSIMSRMQNGLGGYTSPEYQAMREQMARNTNQNFMTGRAQLARGQANNRLGSTQRTAQLMELSRNFGKDRAQQEQDLMVKSADESARRQAEYQNLLRGVEADEFGRVNTARGAYGTTLSGDQNLRFEKDKVNLDQESKDKAGQLELILGLMQQFEGRRNQRRQTSLAREQMRSNENIARSANSGGGGGGGLGQEGYDLIMAEIDRIRNS